MCRCFQQWVLEHSHTNKPGSGRHCASSFGCRNSIQGRNPDTKVHLLCHKDCWEYSACSRSQSTCAYSISRLPLTLRHHQTRLLWCRESVDWRVEWRSVVFSDESRFCLYASGGRTSVRRRPGNHHLPDCIHSTTHRTHLRFNTVGAISYNSRSHWVFLESKVK